MPVRRKNPWRDMNEEAVSKLEQRLADAAHATVTGASSRKRYEVKTYAGVLWPAGWIPEEPGKNFKRGRDDCFRWRVEDLLWSFGWKTWHITDPKLSDPGLPDLLCLRDRAMWIENKVRNMDGRPNPLSPAQQAFIAALTAAGEEVHCILWPDDWKKLEELVR